MSGVNVGLQELQNAAQKMHTAISSIERAHRADADGDDAGRD